MLTIQPKCIREDYMLLYTYAPPKRINKNKLKFKSKLWMSLGLQKTISVKKQTMYKFY